MGCVDSAPSVRPCGTKSSPSSLEEELFPVGLGGNVDGATREDDCAGGKVELVTMVKTDVMAELSELIELAPGLGVARMLLEIFSWSRLVTEGSEVREGRVTDDEIGVLDGIATVGEAELRSDMLCAETRTTGTKSARQKPCALENFMLMIVKIQRTCRSGCCCYDEHCTPDTTILSICITASIESKHPSPLPEALDVTEYLSPRLSLLFGVYCLNEVECVALGKWVVPW
jgi:hypothetical protein